MRDVFRARGNCRTDMRAGRPRMPDRRNNSLIGEMSDEFFRSVLFLSLIHISVLFMSHFYWTSCFQLSDPLMRLFCSLIVFSLFDKYRSPDGQERDSGINPDHTPATGPAIVRAGGRIRL